MDMVLLAITVSALAAAAGSTTTAVVLYRREKARAAARVAALSSALDRTAAPVPVSNLFRRDEDMTLPGRVPVALVAAGGAAVLLLLGLTVTGLGDGRSDAGAVAAAPLELMSVEHARAGRTLTVSGLVRNPPGGDERERVTAVVLAFNSVGAIVGSGRALLDLISLGPGQESPFIVAIADAEDVGRYTVSFRTSEGLLRHVDRRDTSQQIAGTR